jgi:hypothetical protein
MNIELAPKHIPSSLQERDDNKWQLTIYPHGGTGIELPTIGTIEEVQKAAEKYISKNYIGFSL